MPPKQTADEMRQFKLLQHIIDAGMIYTNSTIEQASKPTGISAMQIKGILQGLADESLVDTDKIGASQYYWRFKSKESQVLQQNLDDLQNKLLAYQKELYSLKKELQDEKIARKETIEQQQLNAEYDSLHKEIKQLESQLTEFQKVDYEEYKSLQDDTAIAIRNANQWTDNCFVLKKYLVKKFLMDSKQVDRMLGINETFDYIEIQN